MKDIKDLGDGSVGGRGWGNLGHSSLSLSLLVDGVILGLCPMVVLGLVEGHLQLMLAKDLDDG